MCLAWAVGGWMDTYGLHRAQYSVNQNIHHPQKCVLLSSVYTVLYCTVLHCTVLCLQGELAGGVPVLRSLQPRHHHPRHPPQVQHPHQCHNSLVNKLMFCLIHRKLKVFKYSSPTFLSLTLLGCCIMYR